MTIEIIIVSHIVDLPMNSMVSFLPIVFSLCYQRVLLQACHEPPPEDPRPIGPQGVDGMSPAALKCIDRGPGERLMGTVKVDKKPGDVWKLRIASLLIPIAP